MSIQPAPTPPPPDAARRATARHLRVVDESPKFSALPHAVIRDVSLSRDARLLVAVILMYAWQDGECRASHARLAADLGCSVRMLPTYLGELIAAGVITEHAAGVRRQKVYRVVSIGTGLPIETTANEKQGSDSEPVNRQSGSDSTAGNRKFSTGQSEVFDTSNRKRSSDSKKKTPEEDPPPTGEGVAAGAAPAPPARTKSRRVRSKQPSPEETEAPATIELTEVSYASALKMGFDRAAVDLELEAFLSKARAKRWTYVDWKEAFRNWLINEVKNAKRYGRPVGSHPARTGAASPPNPSAPSAPANVKGTY